MLDSVRARLTVWYTVLMTGALLTIAVITYFGIRQNIIRRTDAGLADLADSFLTTLTNELHDQPEPSIAEAAGAAIAEHNFRDVTFIILDETQQPIATSQNGVVSQRSAEGLLEFERKATRARAAGASRSFYGFHVGDRSYRGYAKMFAAKNRKYTVVLLQSLERQQEFLEEVGTTFALLIPMVIVLTGAGGYFLARRSLAPVVAMSSQAEHIGAINLHERLPVKNAKDELGLLAASFNGLLERLDQSFEQQRRFIADASHEMRTPVAVLCGEAEVALSQQTRPAEEYRESLEVLQREARRLKLIIDDLFTLARADAGQYPVAPSAVYLDELAVDCCRTVRTLAQAKATAVHCEDVQETPVWGDAALLRRMILNLLDNAIKYTPKNGAVSVRCEVHGASCSLSVSDNGPGVPRELQGRIFERFFRADKVRARSESSAGGAGLGLSICRWIAEAHRGQLVLAHSDERGSTFTFTMPSRSATQS